VSLPVRLAFVLALVALCAWLLWPRSAPSLPAIEPLAQGPEPVAANAQVQAAEVAHSEPPSSRTQVETPPSSPSEPATPAPRSKKQPDPPPPGTIEALVVRGRRNARQPVAGAQVTLHRSEDEEDSRPAREQPQIAIGFSDADGICRFAGVEPGHYVLHAVSGESEREAKAWVRRGKSTPQVALAFGTSRIHGTVYDLEGKPFPGCTLRLDYTTESNRTSTPSTLRAIASTDANGNYAFGELEYDTYSLVLSGPGRKWTDGWPGRTWILRPPEDQDLQLDGGTPQGWEHWTGVLRRPDGTAVQESRPINLSCNDPPRMEGVLKIRLETRNSDTGDFDFPLEPGTWSATVSTVPWGSDLYMEKWHDVPVGGLHEDIAAP
jgi:hypothetical protein